MFSVFRSGVKARSSSPRPSQPSRPAANHSESSAVAETSCDMERPEASTATEQAFLIRLVLASRSVGGARFAKGAPPIPGLEDRP